MGRTHKRRKETSYGRFRIRSRQDEWPIHSLQSEASPRVADDGPGALGTVSLGKVCFLREADLSALWAAGSRPQAQCLLEPVSNRKARYRDPAIRVGWGFCLNLAPKKPCRKVKSNWGGSLAIRLVFAVRAVLPGCRRLHGVFLLGRLLYVSERFFERR